MNKIQIRNSILIGVLIFLAAFSRLVDHPSNFTPITAIILFGVAMFPNKNFKFLFPIAVILLSDIFLEISNKTGFHSGTWVVYLAYTIIFSIGYFILKKVNFVRILTSTLAGSLAFFLITNFVLFYPKTITSSLDFPAYSRDLSGIMSSYIAGVPFFRNMLVGDIFYTLLLFGSYYFIENFIFSKKLTTVK